MSVVNKLIYGGIALALLFILASTVMLPYFSTAWRYCQALQWVGAHGSSYTNCTVPYQTSNTSAVSGTSHTENGITSPVATDSGNSDEFCLNCATQGGYRTTVQGLSVLILVIGLIAFGLHFFGKK